MSSRNQPAKALDLLKRVQLIMSESTLEPGTLGESAAWHLGRPGKLFRARLVIATGLAVNLDEDILLPLAASVELLHNASLVHDDLQDDELLRRGRVTTWRKHGAETALLLGDHWIVRSFALLGQVPCGHAIRRSLLNLFSERVLEVIRGQAIDLEANANPHLGADEYRRLACAKTGALIALAAEAPLVAAGRPAAEVSDARQALMLVGLGYQLADDLEEFVEAAAEPQAAEVLKRLRTSAVAVEYLGRHPEARPAWKDILRAESSAGTLTKLEQLLSGMFASGVANPVAREGLHCLEAAREIATRLPSSLGDLLERQCRDISGRIERVLASLSQVNSGRLGLSRMRQGELSVAAAA